MDHESMAWAIGEGMKPLAESIEKIADYFQPQKNQEPNQVILDICENVKVIIASDEWDFAMLQVRVKAWVIPSPVGDLIVQSFRLSFVDHPWFETAEEALSRPTMVGFRSDYQSHAIAMIAGEIAKDFYLWVHDIKAWVKENPATL